MGVSFDYVITRAVGIRTHLLTTEELHRVVSSRNIAEMIQVVGPHGYHDQLSRYYTSSDPVISIARAIYETINLRWDRIIGHAENGIIQEFNHYREIIDFKNLISLLYQIDDDEPKAVSAFISRLTPGGTISLHVWEELVVEPSLSVIKTKSLIIAPKLHQFFDILEPLDNYSGFPLFEKILNYLNFNWISKDWSSKSQVSQSPTGIMILDFVNRLFLRFVLSNYDPNADEFSRLVELILPWSELSWLMDSEYLRRTPEVEGFFGRTMDLLVNADIIHREPFDNKNVEGLPQRNWEGVVSTKTMELLTTLSREGYNQYLLMKILNQIIIEGRNLIWIAFGLSNNLSKVTIRGGLIEF